MSANTPASSKRFDTVVACFILLALLIAPAACEDPSPPPEKPDFTLEVADTYLRSPDRLKVSFKLGGSHHGKSVAVDLPDPLVATDGQKSPVASSGPIELDISKVPPGPQKYELAARFVSVEEVPPKTVILEFEKPAVELEFTSSTGKLECVGVVSCEGRTISPLGIELSAPKGTRITLEGVTKTVQNDGESVELNPDYTEMLTETSWSDLQKGTIKQTVSIEFPSGEKAETTLSQARSRLVDVLARDAKLMAEEGKALLFPGEEADSSAKDPRNILKCRGSQCYLIGKADTVTDIDLIATVKTEKDVKSCGKYKNKKTGETQELEYELIHYSATVFDRRTGKEVEKKEFRAKKPKCKEVRKHVGRFQVKADEDEVSDWLKGLLD